MGAGADHVERVVIELVLDTGDPDVIQEDLYELPKPLLLVVAKRPESWDMILMRLFPRSGLPGRPGFVWGSFTSDFLDSLVDLPAIDKNPE